MVFKLTICFCFVHMYTLNSFVFAMKLLSIIFITWNKLAMANSKYSSESILLTNFDTISIIRVVVIDGN